MTTKQEESVLKALQGGKSTDTVDLKDIYARQLDADAYADLIKKAAAIASEHAMHFKPNAESASLPYHTLVEMDGGDPDKVIFAEALGFPNEGTVALPFLPDL